MFIRTGLTALCLATTCVLSAHTASTAQSPINATDPCYVLRSVVDLSQWTGATMGFEEEPSDCWRTSAPAGVHGDPPPSDIRELLDQLTARGPSYAWREMDGVFVVRPVEAWKDTRHFLHARVGSFTAREADLTMAVSTLSDAVRPRQFVPWVDVESLRSGIRLDQRLHRGAPLKGPPFAVSFEGGTLLDALNAIVRGHRTVGWMLNYCNGTATLDNAILTASVSDDSIGRMRMIGLFGERGHANPCLGTR